MQKSFGFHVLPAQPSFGCSSPAVSSGYFLGVYPTYSCRSLLRLQDCLFSYQPAPALCGPSFSWEIRFWHVRSTWSGTSYHITNSCRTDNKNNDHEHLLSDIPPSCCLPLAGVVCHMHVTCMEHILSHSSILAGMSHSSHLQRISTMWTIPLPHFIIYQRSWFGTKT